jgi:hypothetical protein
MLFNFRCRYKDDVLSLSNSTFGDYIGPIYPIELDIKDATYKGYYNEDRLRPTLCDNTDDLIFPIVNFIIKINIPRGYIMLFRPIGLFATKDIKVFGFLIFLQQAYTSFSLCWISMFMGYLSLSWVIIA